MSTPCVSGAASPYSLERLSAFVDGDLPASELHTIRQHLEGCPSCAARAQELGAMARAARALELPEPPPTLWPAIEGALDAAEGRRWWLSLGAWRAFGIGALAGGAIVLAVVFGWRRATPARPEVARAVAPRGAGLPASAPADPLLADAEQELARAAAAYEGSIEKLRRLLVREEARWTPEMRARYDERLARLDEAIARSRESAGRLPGDSEGHEQLFAAYQQKIAFLAETVHRGGGFGPGAP
jgi:negative regulator of sigma E activity